MNSNHERDDFPGVNGVNKIKSGICGFTLVTLVLVFFYPGLLCAQQLGSVITFQETIATDEDGGRLYFPSFVYDDPLTDEVYLIDGKGRIIIFSSEFFPLYTLSKRNGIETPQGLALDREGNLYVAQSSSTTNPRNRISVFSPCLKWERDIYLEGFDSARSFVPFRIAINKKGNLFVASNSYAGVLYLDNRGRLIDIITPMEGDRKVIIANVVLDDQDKLYLVSEEEGRIYIYDEQRNFTMKFGEKGGSSGKLSRPRAIDVDNKNGRMYVVDYMRHTITVYNRKGDFIFEFGGLGWGDGWFQHPIDLDIDTRGRIIVADTFNQRVQVFNSW